MELDGFWARMRALWPRYRVAEWADDQGGWQALREGGVRLWRELGLRPQHEGLLRDARLSSRYQVVTAADPSYPKLMQPVHDRPPVLFVEGDVAVLSRPAVAIVGTRRCTPYGVSLARRIARACTSAERVVVSGLAFGIDRHAHEAALETGRTVAVVASGLGSTAPRSHHHLRRRIVAGGGAIVSVWPDAFEAARWTFPARNRWIAALCSATVVVEAPEKSGALHTARHAEELSRTLWAVPGRVGDPNSAGCLELLSRQAHPLLSVERFASDLGVEQERGWMQALEAGAALERVAKLAGLSVVELVQRLQLMEARGELRRLPGNRYERRTAG